MPITPEAEYKPSASETEGAKPETKEKKIAPIAESGSLGDTGNKFTAE